MVLSSSGSRTAFVAGAAYVMIRDLSIQYDAIVGVGMSASAAAHLAQEGLGGLVPQAYSLLASWTTLRRPQETEAPFGRLAAMVQDDDFSDPPWSIFWESLDLGRLVESDVGLSIAGWSVHHGRMVEVEGQSLDIFGGILAAAAPPVCPFSDVQEEEEASPIRTALEMGADSIDVVLDRPLGAEPLRSFVPEATEIAYTQASNELAEAMSGEVERYRTAGRFRVLRPLQELTDDLLAADPFQIRRMIQAGQDGARERFRCR